MECEEIVGATLCYPSFFRQDVSPRPKQKWPKIDLSSSSKPSQTQIRLKPKAPKVIFLNQYKTRIQGFYNTPFVSSGPHGSSVCRNIG